MTNNKIINNKQKGITIFLTLTMVVSLLGIGIVGAASTSATTNTTVESDSVQQAELPEEPASVNSSEETIKQEAEAADVDIDSELFETNESNVEVIVQLDDVPTDGLLDDGSFESVKEESQSTQEELVQWSDAVPGIEVKSQFWITNAVLIEVDQEQAGLQQLVEHEAVEELNKNTELEHPEPEQSASQTEASDDQAYTYGLEQINAPETYTEYGTEGDDSRVVVIDDGINPDHPDIDLADHTGVDSSGELIDSEPSEDTGHGTHVAGTVAGTDESGTQIGVAPETELYKADVGEGDLSTAAIIGAIEWAVENDADVATASLGVPCAEVQSFVDPVENAYDSGTMFIAASGNDGEGCVAGPGNDYNTFSIGASDTDSDIASFSSGGLIEKQDFTNPPESWPETYIKPNVAAPGVNVFSAEGDDYTSKQGTSMAAPHAAGSAALLSSIEPTATPEEIAEALEETAEKPEDWDEDDADWQSGDRDSRYGTGIIDVHAAAAYLADEDDTAEFEVEIADTDEPVEAGDELAAEVDVTNVGGASDTQELTLAANDSVVDSTNVTVDSNENTSQTLNWSTDEHDVGTANVTAETDDDADTQTATIEEPAEFEVESVDTDEPVEAGDELAAEVDVTNVGGVSDTQELTLAANDSVVDSTNVTVDGDENTSQTLNWSTGEDDAGTTNVTVETDDDADTQTATIEEPAEFEVESVDTDEPVEAGEELTVDTEVSNVGEASDTQELTLVSEGSVVDSVDVTADGGESDTHSLTWSTDEDDAGTAEIGVETDDDTDEQTVSIEEATEAGFVPEITDVNDPITAGEELTVDAEITNEGDESQWQYVELHDETGNYVDGEWVYLLDADNSWGAESATVTLSWDTSDEDAGVSGVTVETDDESATESVEIEEASDEPTFTIEDVETNDPITAGETLTVDVEITNTGSEGSQDIELKHDDDWGGFTLDSESVSLSEDETETVTLNWDHASPLYDEVTVDTGDTTETVSVTIESWW